MASPTYKPTGTTTTRPIGFNRQADEKEDISFVEPLATPKKNVHLLANGVVKLVISSKIVPNALRNTGAEEDPLPQEGKDRGISLQPGPILLRPVNIPNQTSKGTRVEGLVNRQLRLVS